MEKLKKYTLITVAILSITSNIRAFEWLRCRREIAAFKKDTTQSIHAPGGYSGGLRIRLESRESLLHLALLRNNRSVAKCITKSLDPVNLQDKSGNTALHRAVTPAEIAKFISIGADINKKNNAGDMALDKAVVNCAIALSRSGKYTKIMHSLNEYRLCQKDVKANNSCDDKYYNLITTIVQCNNK